MTTKPITKEAYQADEHLRDAYHLLEVCFWTAVSTDAPGGALESVGHLISEVQTKIKTAGALVDHETPIHKPSLWNTAIDGLMHARRDNKSP